MNLDTHWQARGTLPFGFADMVIMQSFIVLGKLRYGKVDVVLEGL